MDLNCVLGSWLGCGINVKKGLHVCVLKTKGNAHPTERNANINNNNTTHYRTEIQNAVPQQGSKCWLSVRKKNSNW